MQVKDGQALHLEFKNKISLQAFLKDFPCQPAPSRPNTTALFPLYDATKPPLKNSPSPFVISAWKRLLRPYPDHRLPLSLTLILTFGALVGYTGPKAHIISKNLKSTLLAPEVITTGIDTDIAVGRVRPTTNKAPLISSPLGLVPKSNGRFRRIHHLSYPEGSSVNDNINKAAAYLRYTKFNEFLAMVAEAGQDSVMIKRDMKDAFRNIPLAPHIFWLFGFCWCGSFYTETCLPFGLRTAPFIYNLFAEAFHWMLESYLHLEALVHYLDDFIWVIAALQATDDRLCRDRTAYRVLSAILGIPEEPTKDQQGSQVVFLGLLIDTHTMSASLPIDKLERAIQSTQEASLKGSLTLHEAQELAGFLTFCAQAVRLGWVFMRPLWTFVGSYPRNKGKGYKRRIPPEVLIDLQWWSTLLTEYNGVLFFEKNNRLEVHLYGDACLSGSGAFFTARTDCFWREQTSELKQENAFMALIPAERRTHISVHEADTILCAFEQWGLIWQGYRVTVFTDNQNVYDGLIKGSIRGETNYPIRQVHLLAAKLDIIIEVQWISSGNNELADILSRRSFKALADICPHWQNPFESMLLASRTPGLPTNS